MAYNKTFQAKMIPDLEILILVRALMKSQGSSDLYDIWRAYPHIPEKVVLAKMRTLVDRGYLYGCGCGCRGNFVVAPDGLVYLRRWLSII